MRLPFLRLFVTPFGPNLFGAQAVRGLLFVIGIFTFVGGVLYLPALRLTQGEGIISFFLLLAVMLLCVTVGQLFVIVELLEKRESEKRV